MCSNFSWMMEPAKVLKALVQIAAIVIFSLQMILAIQKYMERPTMSSPGTKTSSALDKSLVAAICKQSQFVYSRADELGYKWSINYLSGETNDESVLSWNGLHGNWTFNEIFNYLYGSNLDEIYIKVSNGTISQRVLLPYGLCKVYEGKPTRALNIKFRETSEQTEYFIFLSDSATSLPFQLPYSLLTGDRIKIVLHPNSTVKKYVHYNIQLKETNVRTGDESCWEYPTQIYESYADCVGAEMKEKILPVLGCMIPWISKSDRCVGPIHRMQGHESLVQWIYTIIRDAFGGIQYQSESCLLPCSVLSLHATYLQSGSGDFEDFDSVDLFFSKSVKVETVMLAYDFTALLVEIGSCLGLWLGLSVVGVLDVSLLATFHVKKSVYSLYEKNKNINRK